MRTVKHAILLLTAIILTAVPAFAGDTSGETGAVTASIPVKCSGPAGDFIIEPGSAAFPVPDMKAIHVPENGSGVFQVEYKAPGTYTYSIKQVPTRQVDVTYDESMYDVAVFVWYDGDVMKAETTIVRTGSKSKSLAAAFENRTNTPPPTTEEEPHTTAEEPPTTTQEPPVTTEAPTEPEETTVKPTETTPVPRETETPTRPNEITTSDSSLERNTEPPTDITSIAKSIQTGDAFPVILILIAACVSVCTMVWFFTRKRRNSSITHD